MSGDQSRSTTLLVGKVKMIINFVLLFLSPSVCLCRYTTVAEAAALELQHFPLKAVRG